MNGKPSFASPGGLAIFSAAVLAGVVAGTLLSAVVMLFQSRGTPMAELAAAERVCDRRLYRSEQAACIREWLAAKRATSVANR